MKTGKLVLLESERVSKTDGWEEHNFTFTYPANATSDLFVCFGLMHSKGTMYFDNMQLEEGTVANSYNMVENSVFEYPGDNDKNWQRYNATSTLDDVKTISNGFNVFRLNGDTSKERECIKLL